MLKLYAICKDMGNYQDLEIILELYMPMIENNSYLYGRLDEDLR